jgi:hypothetical protein
MQFLCNACVPLIGISGMSLQNGNTSHGWDLTTKKSEHLRNPNMMVSGGIPIHVFLHDLLSTCGELQGQTALVITASNLLSTDDAKYITTKLYVTTKVSKSD